MTSNLAARATIALMLSLPVPALAQDTAETAPEQQQDVSAETVVARIGEDEITMGHVASLLSQLPAQYQQLPDDVLFEGIVDQLVDQYLLSSEIENGNAVSERLRLRLENERRAMLASQTIEEMMMTEFSDAEIQAAYDDTFGNMEPQTEYNASHILVETEEAAQEIVTELEGGADFAELAKEKSTGPSGPEGGSLGWFGTGMMVPEFENAVVDMEPGAVSAPVQTQFGWHVIKLNETRDKPAPELDQVRENLVDQLRQNALQAKIDGLRDSADVEILTDGLAPGAFRNEDILTD